MHSLQASPGDLQTSQFQCRQGLGSPRKLTVARCVAPVVLDADGAGLEGPPRPWARVGCSPRCPTMRCSAARPPPRPGRSRNAPGLQNLLVSRAGHHHECCGCDRSFVNIAPQSLSALLWMVEGIAASAVHSSAPSTGDSDNEQQLNI